MSGSVDAMPSDPSPDMLDDEILEENDSLHILPLNIIPLESASLNSARLIKNVRLESVMEFFRGEGTGSGQMDVQDLPAQMGWPEDITHPDFDVIRKLSKLPSYDVYSLRILLRSLGIPVNNEEHLRLSPGKVAELSDYMTSFTRPLILQLFGEKELKLDTFDDVIKLFRDPDVQKARSRLQTMAESLDISILEVPQFLEDFGDIFLSLSYYRQSLDSIAPIIDEFVDSLKEIRENRQLSTDRNIVKSCIEIEETLNGSMSAVTGRFENFDRSADDMWTNLDAERFRKVKESIRSYHTTIGGVLCALTVKMTAWRELFPTRNFGGPVKRSEFIMSEMKQGIQKIKSIEETALALSSVSSAN